MKNKMLLKSSLVSFLCTFLFGVDLDNLRLEYRRVTIQDGDMQTNIIDTSFLSIEQIKDTRRFLTLQAYKENYVLFYQSLPPGIYQPNMKQEIKTRFSIKVPLWREAIFEKGTLYFGYTQTMWFQFLNFSYSNPVRDADYNPEIFYQYSFDSDFLGGTFKYIRLGLSHLSNGVGGRECFRPTKDTQYRSPKCKSRSAGNRIVLTLNQEWNRFGFILNAWPYIPKRYDNPDLTKYMGYGDLRLYYEDKRNLAELSIDSVFTDYRDYRGNVRLGYTFKVNKDYGIYLQYFYGYGDSLFEYNIKSQRIGIGIRM